MKKLLLVLIILFIWTGLFSQSKGIIFNKVIVNELINGQPLGKKYEEDKRVPCTINQSMIQVNHLKENGSVLEFQVEKAETNSTGTTKYTCELDGEEYNIVLIPDNSAMIITGTKEIILLQKNKLETVERQTKEVKIEKKNCP